MEALLDIAYSLPPGAWTVISLISAALIFMWLQIDIRRRRQRDEGRAARMERLKQEAIAKLRDEKSGEP